MPALRRLDEPVKRAHRGRHRAPAAYCHAVYDGCSCSAKVIGTTGPVTLKPGAATRVDVVWSAAVKGSHTITAVVDPARAVRESDEGNNKCQATLTVS